ncbi:conserved hypothetical protein [Hahella chejuensis KCTC 2396]|uniref:PEGA domain-containing protein n=1 Tax=Hahella chejuensis (strain KCTC 2396) TaxID=349521 RepID=Q2SGH9_HAHCH|nr:hypothetical protein [Hahella chejuensis]ABC30245.1 conserved hypothetical protein [Hahella chejuensis KCTC 2396]
MKTVLSLTLCAASIVLASGCASIVSGNSYPLAIESHPSQAQFVITNKNGDAIHSGVTPETVTLQSGSGYFSSEKYKVRFSKTGFHEKEVEVNTTLDGWYFGNILLGGLIGLLVVDPVTGAMWKLPEKTEVTLDEVVANGSQTHIKIVTIDDVPMADRNRLIPLR